MKTYVEKLIKEKSVTELDLRFPFYDEEYPENRNEIMVPSNQLGFTEAPSMSINEAIKILKDLKDLGANRVYFAAHSDHHGYYFYGTKLMEI